MWVRERKRGGRETEGSREMLPLYVHFCVVWPSPGVRDLGLLALGMSCVCLYGEGSSFVAGSNAGIYDCILSMEVAYIDILYMYNMT